MFWCIFNYYYYCIFFVDNGSLEYVYEYGWQKSSKRDFIGVSKFHSNVMLNMLIMNCLLAEWCKACVNGSQTLSLPRFESRLVQILV